MADNKSLRLIISEIETAIKNGHASDSAKKAEIIGLLRQLKAGVQAHDHGPVDDLISALEGSAVGLEASHPTLTAYLDRASRLLASIGI
jgi:hypothetical protein